MRRTPGKRLAAVLCALITGAALGSAPKAHNTFEGRWLFQGISQTGRKVPLFILEFKPDLSPGGKILSTTAPFPIEVRRTKVEGRNLTLELLADGEPLTLKGTIDSGVIRGKTTGDTLGGLTFVAEPTHLTALEKFKAPERGQVDEYQAARSSRDPSERVSQLRNFLERYPETALKTAALLDIFEALLQREAPESQLVAAIEEAIRSSRDRATVMNDIAFSLAQKNKLLDKAEELSRKALAELDGEGAARASFLDTLGWVLYRKGDLENAGEELTRAALLAPRQGEILLHLAEVMTAQGNTEAAIEAYLQAEVGAGNRRAGASARELYSRRKGSLEGFHELLDQVYAKLPPPFDPGRYEGDYKGPAIVAELFTGAQCAPCQAADYAFDGLQQHFPRNVLTVLQYHLHVPGPDPMTSPDSIARARLYGIGSTPIAIVDGKVRQPGGGPMSNAPVLFRRYSELVAERLKQERTAQINLTATRNGDAIEVSGSVRVPRDKAAPPGGSKPGELRLMLALVEKTIHYTGANNVHIHRNVVRKFLNGPEGTPVTKPDFAFSNKSSLSEIETNLQAYLDTLSEKLEMTFVDAPVKLNRDDLEIAALLQHTGTREILASALSPLQSVPSRDDANGRITVYDEGAPGSPRHP